MSDAVRPRRQVVYPSLRPSVYVSCSKSLKLSVFASDTLVSSFIQQPVRILVASEPRNRP
jgi:hypothetical protein